MCLEGSSKYKFPLQSFAMFGEPSLSKQIAHWLPFPNRIIIDMKHHGTVIAMFCVVNEVIIQQKTKPNKSRWRGGRR